MNNEITLDITHEDMLSVQERIQESSIRISEQAKPIGLLRVQEIANRMAPSANLYESVVEELSQGTRNTPGQIKYLEAFETALAVFRAASYELRKKMDVLTLEQRLGSQQQALEARHLANTLPYSSAEKDADTAELQKAITDAVFLSNRYALYFAGNIGLSLLDSSGATVTSNLTFGQNDASQDRDELTRELSRLTTKKLIELAAEKSKRGQENDDATCKETLEATFTSWVNQFDWRTFEDIAKARGIAETTLRQGNYSLKAGEFKRKYDVVVIDDKFMGIKKEDVIGGQELGDIIWDNLIKLSAYSHEMKRNPYNPAKVIFTYGAPGCGKTFTAHALIRSFGELCRTKGIPFWALTHSTTDYASHYQNKTANELSALAERIKDFPGAVAMYVADADNLFHSRKDPNITVEQQQTLGVYFKMFDGQLIPKNGKFMAIMDANYIEGIDDATKSRLFDEIVEMKRFSTPEQFAELSRRTLTKGLETHLLKDVEWLEIGKFLLNSPLSNREIDHVIGRLRRDFKVPEDMVGKLFEEHERYRNEKMSGVTKDYILEKFEGYSKTRMEIDRASYEARRTEDYARFQMALEQHVRDTQGVAQP